MNEGYRIYGTESEMTPGLQVFRRETAEGEARQELVRVAAYCRVSTDLDTQESSLEIQMDSFQQTIARHPGWALAGIYADKGLSGTTAGRRVQFQKMIKDAEMGKIDRILAKSISRFARNTVDTLHYTRMLREKGIGVYFEEQGIDTINLSTELYLTIAAAFSQEESHSISENMKVALRSRFAMGIPKWSATYGYRKVGEDDWRPDAKESKVVRRIFSEYANGKSLPAIAEALEAEKIPGPGVENNKRWYSHTISTILHNEKYIGDVAMQKDYTIDHLTHKRRKNKDAMIPRYYMRNHHPAIVDRGLFDEVQVILEMKDLHRGSSQYPLYGFLKCPFCKENMISVRLPSRFHHQAWTCGGKTGSGEKRDDRTDCLPYFVKHRFLPAAVWRAFADVLCAELSRRKEEYPAAVDALKYKKEQNNEVTYPFLRKLVDSITFETENGRVNWNRLVVTWKFGMKTTATVEYEKASEIPVTEETAEYKNNTYYANGQPTNGQIAAYNSVLQLLDFCREIRIIDTPEQDKVGDTLTKIISIPVVLTGNTVKRDRRKRK